MRVAYFYFMKEEPDRIPVVAPDHANYWRELELPEYSGGPFADRSGGLITFQVESRDQAAAMVAGDPFVRESLLEHSWVKEWIVD